MTHKVIFKYTLLILGIVFLSRAGAQCSDCSIIVTDNSTPAYTVSSGQKLCLLGNFTYTGNLTLNGGTICNSSEIKKITFRSGTFNNSVTGKISAASRSDLRFDLNGKTILNNLSGSQIVVNDSLCISSAISDSLIINIHKGSSINCENLYFNLNAAFVNIGLAATTTTNNSFITSLNVNNDALFASNVAIAIHEESSLNTNRNLTLSSAGIKSLSNSGIVNVPGFFEILGSGVSASTVTINNYGELYVFSSLNVTITDAVVTLNNYPSLSSSIIYVQDRMNIEQANTLVNNAGHLQVDYSIELLYGTFLNDSYVETGELNISTATVTNNSNLMTQYSANLLTSDGVLNNNGNIFVATSFRNNGEVNLGSGSNLVTFDFDNVLSTSQVNGPTGDITAINDYGKIFAGGATRNNGALTGYLLFQDFSNPEDVIRLDDIGPGHTKGDKVKFYQECTFDLEVGFIKAGTSMSTRPRVEFCAGENINLALNSYVPILSGPYWTYGVTSGSVSSSMGMNVSVFDIQSGGTITASGTYFNGKTSCSFNVDFILSLRNGTINTTSPVHFGPGNTIVITPTVIPPVGIIHYTWSPNYAFVSPSTPNDQNPVVAPQVSMVYTVEMTDGYGCTASNTVEVVAEPFAALDKELNGEYYNLFDNQLFFKYEGQYDVAPLIYKVLDKTNTVVASNTINNIINTTTVFPGDNRLTLNASALNSGVYILEIQNEKKEKMYLRFKR